jgi:flagellar hook protein FlgE
MYKWYTKKMIDAISSALTGLTTASTKVAQSAERIANVSTPGIGDTVDLSEEAVNMKLAEIAYKANVQTLKASQEMTDELLSVFDERV